MFLFIQNKLKYFLLIFIINSSAFCLAQSGSTSKKADKLFKESVKAQQNREFHMAIAHLEKAIQIDNKFTNAYYSLAKIHTFLRNGKKAIGYYEKIIEIEPNNKNYMIAYYFVAKNALAFGEYEKAKKNAESFLKLKPNIRNYKSQIKKTKIIIDRSKFAIEGINNPVDFNPNSLKIVDNTFTKQYFPVLTADQNTMIFTALTKEGDENMYESSFSQNQWSKPLSIDELNTKNNEGTCSISADGKTIIFTACKGFDKREIIGACDLFISKKVGGEWSKPKNMGRGINSRSWESQPALSADGRMILFVSDRPGGIGRKDIWVSHLEENGEWGRALNLGDRINTIGDEVSPFLHVNGQTLFFASNQHMGFGGFDLFKSELEDNEWQWGEAKNLGYPINNFEDQVALFITSDGKKGYYSNEKTEHGEIISSYINVFDLPEEIRIKKVSDFVKGKVFNAKTKELIGAKIDLVNLENDEVISSVDSDSKLGDYLIVLTEGAEYALYVNKPGYLFKSLFFDYREGVKHNAIELDIFLDPIEKGSKVTLNNIFFESGSYGLLDKSKTELNKLVKFLEANTKTKIEISGHTDNVGKDTYNQKLSLNRAKSVTDYLLGTGINKNRIISKGYGETMNVASNDTEAGRAKNRRIEFKIIE